MHWGTRHTVLLRKEELSQVRMDLMRVFRFDVNQPRDKDGKWTNTGSIGPRSEGITGATINAHMDEHGFYTKERVAFHDKLMHELIDPIPDAVGQPTVFMTGGGPAAGKSSVLEAGFTGFPSKTEAVYISADDFKEKLTEYQEMRKAGDIDAGAKAHDESSDLAWTSLDNAQQSKNVVYDGTGDNSIDKLTARVAKIRESGARVVADYVTQSVDQAMKNMIARGIKTGRYVPESALREIHKNVSLVFPKVLDSKIFDEVRLFDTQIFGQPRLVVSQKNGITTIHDQTLYDTFLAKGNA